VPAADAGAHEETRTTHLDGTGTESYRSLTVGGAYSWTALADRVKGSRHHSMKKLRSAGLNIGVLLACDPKRKAILLIGRRQDGRCRR
jgi:hypothetical protein